ncbi:vWA domain-containing protein [Metabacillus sp. RGM 3146]|uniref:vWA domain-containing protein n=1 Tax=Metabacillus sp. RGM 3146 TaxID=3401092 RepID=UPI003B9D2FDC
MRINGRAVSFTALFLILVQVFIPIKFASAAASGISLDASVSAPQNQLQREFTNRNPETNVILNLLPQGKAPSTERDPADVVFVFDKSGSMGIDKISGQPKLLYAQQAVREAVKTFSDNNKNRKVKDRFALVSFDSDVNSQYSQFTFKEDPNSIATIVNTITAGGGTTYTQALEKARQIFEQDPLSQNRKKYIIFMTDGKPTNSHK